MKQDIRMSVETTDDNELVVICAQTVVAGDSEDRSYFLSPAHAVEFANAMLHAAEVCGVVVEVQSTGISDVKRARIIKRCEHVIRSLSGRKPFYVSVQVVDTVLSEVL